MKRDAAMSKISDIIIRADNLILSLDEGIGNDDCGDALDELDNALIHLRTAESFLSQPWGSEDR